MRVSATAQLCIRSHFITYSMQLHSLLNKQILLIRQKTVHKIFSFFPQFLQKRKKVSTKASLWPALWLAIQKEVISKPKQPSCKKRVRPQKGQDE